MNKKVLIGLSTNEYVRNAAIMQYVLALERPEPPTVNALLTVHGQSPAQARNTIIEEAIKQECTHILFIDDDMATPTDTLIRLLAHDKDIVSGLYLSRSFPHFPVAFDMAFENGYNKFIYLEPDVDGLVEITNCGLGCVLIKTEIFKKLEKPYVRLGEIEKDGWCDDVGFFNRCRAAGIKLYLDTTVRIGHMSTVTLFPNKVPNQGWFTEYRYMGGNVLIPQTIPSQEQTDSEISRHQEDIARQKALSA